MLAPQTRGPVKALRLTAHCVGFLAFLAFHRPGCITMTPSAEWLDESSKGSEHGQLTFLNNLIGHLLKLSPLVKKTRTAPTGGGGRRGSSSIDAADSPVTDRRKSSAGAGGFGSTSLYPDDSEFVSEKDAWRLNELRRDIWSRTMDGVCATVLSSTALKRWPDKMVVPGCVDEEHAGGGGGDGGVSGRRQSGMGASIGRGRRNTVAMSGSPRSGMISSGSATDLFSELNVSPLPGSKSVGSKTNRRRSDFGSPVKSAASNLQFVKPSLRKVLPAIRKNPAESEHFPLRVEELDQGIYTRLSPAHSADYMHEMNLQNLSQVLGRMPLTGQTDEPQGRCYLAYVSLVASFFESVDKTAASQTKQCRRLPFPVLWQVARAARWACMKLNKSSSSKAFRNVREALLARKGTTINASKREVQRMEALAHLSTSNETAGEEEDNMRKALEKSTKKELAKKKKAKKQKAKVVLEKVKKQRKERRRDAGMNRKHLGKMVHTINTWKTKGNEDDSDDDDGMEKPVEPCPKEVLIKLIQHASICLSWWCQAATERQTEKCSLTYFARVAQIQYPDYLMGAAEGANEVDGDTHNISEANDEGPVLVRTMIMLLYSSQVISDTKLENVCTQAIAVLCNIMTPAIAHAAFQRDGAVALCAACDPAGVNIKGGAEACGAHLGAVVAICGLASTYVDRMHAVRQGDNVLTKDFQVLGFPRRLADAGCISALLRVVQGDTSTGPRRLNLRRTVSGGVAQLAEKAVHVRLSEADAASLVALVRGCPGQDVNDPVALEHAALAMWALARDPYNAVLIGSAGAFPVLIRLLRHWGIAPAVPGGDEAGQATALYTRKQMDGWKFEQLQRIRKYTNLLGNLLSCVFVLSYSPSNRHIIADDVRTPEGGWDCIGRVLTDVLTLPFTLPYDDEDSFLRLIMIGLWTTWVLASDHVTATRLLELGLATALFNTNSAIAENVVAILQAISRHEECFHMLARDTAMVARVAALDQPNRDWAARLPRWDETEPDTMAVEKAIMGLIELDRPEAQLYGCQCLTRLAIEDEERVVFQELGAVESMLKLSFDPPQGAGKSVANGVQIAATRALLNLTTSPQLQVHVCRVGLYDLLELSWKPVPLEVIVNISGVLANLSQHAANRTPLYRAELHVKSEQLKGKELAKMDMLGGHGGDREKEYWAAQATRVPAAVTSPRENSVVGPPPHASLSDFNIWLENLTVSKELADSSNKDARRLDKFRIKAQRTKELLLKGGSYGVHSASSDELLEQIEVKEEIKKMWDERQKEFRLTRNATLPRLMMEASNPNEAPPVAAATRRRGGLSGGQQKSASAGKTVKAEKNKYFIKPTVTERLRVSVATGAAARRRAGEMVLQGMGNSDSDRDSSSGSDNGRDRNRIINSDSDSDGDGDGDGDNIGVGVMSGGSGGRSMFPMSPIKAAGKHTTFGSGTRGGTIPATSSDFSDAGTMGPPTLTPGPTFNLSMNSKIDNMWSRVHTRNGDIGRRRSVMIIRSTGQDMGFGTRRGTSAALPPNMPVDANVWVRCEVESCPMPSALHYTSPLHESDLLLSQTCLRHRLSPGIPPFWINDAALVHHAQVPAGEGPRSALILPDPLPSKPESLDRILCRGLPKPVLFPMRDTDKYDLSYPACRKCPAPPEPLEVRALPLRRLILRSDKTTAVDKPTERKKVETPSDKVNEVEKKLPWRIFYPRLKEADSRSYYDDFKQQSRMFALDWKRCAETSKFKKFIAKAMGVKTRTKFPLDEDADRACAEIAERLKVPMRAHYYWLQLSFEFYCVMGTSEDFSCMQQNQFNDICRDARIMKKGIKQKHVDQIFAATNQETIEDSNTSKETKQENAANADKAFMRFEFLEAVCRIGVQKFCRRNKATADDIIEAVTRINEEHFALNDGEGSCNARIHDKNQWRDENMLNDEIDDILGRAQPMLKNLFNVFKGEFNRVKKKDRMPLKYFMAMLKHMKFMDSDFTVREAKLCFQQGKMYKRDELRSVATFGYITFVDFMEALCRVAALKNMPSEEDLSEMYGRKMIKAATYVDYITATQSVKKAVEGALIRRASSDWSAPKTRPLYEKVTILIKMILARYDFGGDGLLDGEDLKDLYNEINHA